MEEARVRQGLGAVGFQDQPAELRLLLRQRLFFLFSGESARHIQIGLALIASEVQHFKGAEGFAGSFQLALHLNQSFSSRMNAELTEVGDDPFAAQLFGHGSRRAATAEKIRHQIAFVAAGLDNAVNERFWLLCWLAKFLGRNSSHV